MAVSPGASPALFLRESEVRRGIELIFFGQAALNRALDPVLAEAGLGRAHARVLYFIARHPGLTVGRLLALLGITKQALGRVVTELSERGLIESQTGRDDRRQRLLRLTAEGGALEARLFEAMRGRMAAAYADAGPEAVGGFWAVLGQMPQP